MNLFSKNTPKKLTPHNGCFAKVWLLARTEKLCDVIFTPAIVHIQNKQDCKEGTIAIEFDCTWDIENCLGVKIENWKVVKASVAEIVYF